MINPSLILTSFSCQLLVKGYEYLECKLYIPFSCSYPLHHYLNLETIWIFLIASIPRLFYPIPFILQMILLLLHTFIQIPPRHTSCMAITQIRAKSPYFLVLFTTSILLPLLLPTLMDNFWEIAQDHFWFIVLILSHYHEEMEVFHIP